MAASRCRGRPVHGTHGVRRHGRSSGAPGSKVRSAAAGGPRTPGGRTVDPPLAPYRRGAVPRMTGWLLRYNGWDPDAEALRETLCALGNGRFATRAAAPERRAGDGSYPGTYAAGVFDRLTDEVGGRRLANESIVNLPDWQSLTFRVEDGPWLDLSAVAVSDYVQELDLRRGVLTRRFRTEDGECRRTRVAQRRLVSMADSCV